MLGLVRARTYVSKVTPAPICFNPARQAMNTPRWMGSFHHIKKIYGVDFSFYFSLQHSLQKDLYEELKKIEWV